MNWPPPYDSAIAAPAGEPATLSWVPNQGHLDYAHRALQVTFMGLALAGLVLLLRSEGTRSVLRGAARKHAVS